DEDDVSAMARGDERVEGGADEAAVELRRDLVEPALAVRVGEPLRRQPAGLVGLVPDRPVVDAGNRRRLRGLTRRPAEDVGALLRRAAGRELAAVAVADRADEHVELRGG